VFVGRSNLLALTEQLIEVSGGTQVAPWETRPVLVVEGLGGSGRSALLRQIREQWAGRTPTVLVFPLALPSEHESTVRPVLAAVMLGLSAEVPGFKVAFPRVVLAQIAMAEPAVDDDPALAVDEMTRRVRGYREPIALLQFVGDLVRTAGRLGAGRLPGVEAIAPDLADNLAKTVVARLRGSGWLTKLSWRDALDWFGSNSQMGNNDPMRALALLNRKARSIKPAVREELDDQLVGALLADLRHSLARATGRPTNVVVLLDDCDAPSASAFAASLLRVRRTTATAPGGTAPPDPLTLITVSGGALGQHLAASQSTSVREHESRLSELNRVQLRQSGPLLRVSSADLLPQDVLQLTRDPELFDWPLEPGTGVISDAVHRLTDGHPEATMLVLRKLAQEPQLIDDLGAALRRDGPAGLPVEEYLLHRIVTALSPHRRLNPALVGMLVTLSAGRDRLEAQSLSSLLKSGRGDRGMLLDSPTLWSHPGPGSEPSLHPFVRYLCLRALASRGKNHPAGWDKVFTMLRAAVAPDDLAGRLHHDLALAETGAQTQAVAGELAGLLLRMPAEDWLSLLDRVVATPNPRRTGRAANLLDEDAAEHGPRPGSVARLLEVLHRLSDRCLSDQTILCGLYLLAEHDCEQLADSARNSVVLIRRATRYRRLAAPLL
jgi:hypothetical protein